MTDCRVRPVYERDLTDGRWAHKRPEFPALFVFAFRLADTGAFACYAGGLPTLLISRGYRRPLPVTFSAGSPPVVLRNWLRSIWRSSSDRRPGEPLLCQNTLQWSPAWLMYPRQHRAKALY